MAKHASKELELKGEVKWVTKTVGMLLSSLRRKSKRIELTMVLLLHGLETQRLRLNVIA